MLENSIIKCKMSKTITRKSKTKEKGEGQLGVADIDPHELDIRRTRHGTYPAPGTPTGTTWKLQLQRFRIKMKKSPHLQMWYHPLWKQWNQMKPKKLRQP